ncbi:MAG: ankyrin repeat domain-containing protein [Planctomycetota bacterium]
MPSKKIPAAVYRKFRDRSPIGGSLLKQFEKASQGKLSARGFENLKEAFREEGLLVDGELSQGACEELVWAVRMNERGKVRLLVQLGGTAQSCDACGDSALFWAVRLNRTPLVRLLFPSATQEELDHCLNDAAQNLQFKMVELLVANGANCSGDLLARLCHMGDNSRGSLEKILRFLLSSGVDPDSVSAILGTPLMAAVSIGNCQIVELLIESGADVNQLVDGYTALHMGALDTYGAGVDLLLDNGADVKLANRQKKKAKTLYRKHNRSKLERVS